MYMHVLVHSCMYHVQTCMYHLPNHVHRYRTPDVSLCEAKQCVFRVLYIWGPGGLKLLPLSILVRCQA
jgi:hypothetical protein